MPRFAQMTEMSAVANIAITQQDNQMSEIVTDIWAGNLTVILGQMCKTDTDIWARCLTDILGQMCDTDTDICVGCETDTDICPGPNVCFDTNICPRPDV